MLICPTCRGHFEGLRLRRLIGPLEHYDASLPEWQVPDFIKADCVVKTGLIDGLAEIHDVASPPGTAPDIVLPMLHRVFEGEARRRAA